MGNRCLYQSCSLTIVWLVCAVQVKLLGGNTYCSKASFFLNCSNRSGFFLVSLMCLVSSWIKASNSRYPGAYLFCLYKLAPTLAPSFLSVFPSLLFQLKFTGWSYSSVGRYTWTSSCFRISVFLVPKTIGSSVVLEIVVVVLYISLSCFCVVVSSVLSVVGVSMVGKVVLTWWGVVCLFSICCEVTVQVDVDLVVCSVFLVGTFLVFLTGVCTPTQWNQTLMLIFVNGAFCSLKFLF